MLLFVGSIPAGIVGVVFSDAIKPLFTAPGVAALGLLATSCILTAAWWIRGKGHRSMADLTVMSALFIGDWVSYYLAVLYAIDPTPVKSIDYLKKRLSEAE